VFKSLSGGDRASAGGVKRKRADVPLEAVARDFLIISDAAAGPPAIGAILDQGGIS
jgi:hypothetical protein